MFKKKKKKEDSLGFKKINIEIEREDLKEDIELLLSIQSKGGVTFKNSDYINLGSHYVKVINIYKMPSRITDNWIRKIIDFKDTMITFDTVAKNSKDVQSAINKSIMEQQQRQQTDKYSDFKDAQKEQYDLEMLYQRIIDMGEVVKYTHIRIFVTSYSLEELNKKVEKIMNRLDSLNYQATVYLNQGKMHYRSILMGLEEQLKENDIKIGNLLGRSFPLTSEQIALGNPYHYTDLSDPTGSLFGFTKSGGAFIFDPFTKQNSRQLAHGIVIGMQRFGKSTFLKKLFRQRAERGEYIRTISSSDEFKRITNEFGGVFLTEELTLNPLEILKSSEDVFHTFANHISKQLTFFKAINKEADQRLLTAYGNLLREFYHSKGFNPAVDKNISERASSEYPIFSDLLIYIEEKISKAKNLDTKDINEIEKTILINETTLLDTIKKEIEKIVEVYGNYFNRKSTVSNLANEKIVTIDIENIKKNKDIFVAYMINILTLFWDNCINIGKETKRLHDNNQVSFEDAMKFTVLMDEAHNYVNTNFEMVLDMINVYLRESPKYFGQMWFASHDIRDFYPDGDEGGAISKLKTLFGLTQYKILFKQLDGADVVLENIFKNRFSRYQKKRLNSFDKGECFFMISGESITEVKIWLSKKKDNGYEEEIYTGGN